MPHALAIANLHGELVSGVRRHVWGWYIEPTRLYALMTALMNVGTEPVVPDSPTPLAPSSDTLDSVSTCPTSMSGGRRSKTSTSS